MQLPFSLFIKPVGSSCNLDCSYCYYLNNNKQHKMSVEALRTMISEHILAQLRTHLLSTLFGMEESR